MQNSGISGNDKSEKRQMGYVAKNQGILLGPPTDSVASLNYHDTIVNALTCHQKMLDAALAQFIKGATLFTKATARLIETLRTGHKVLVAGNGGSAAEAQHFAAELVGRFKRERSPYAVLSLTADTSIITAVANDYGYQDVFARQVSAFGQPGDMLLAFSTSGESENLMRAAEAAQRCLMTVIAVTGDRPNRLECLADVTVHMPSVDTAITQELHMVVTHILCDIVESELVAYREMRADEA
jgi:D-sedoheptulose 7-phosphate isomerase